MSSFSRDRHPAASKIPKTVYLIALLAPSTSSVTIGNRRSTAIRCRGVQAVPLATLFMVRLGQTREVFIVGTLRSIVQFPSGLLPVISWLKVH